MKKILVIGIGAGHPGHITVQAVEALNKVDAFFLIDKGEERGDLARLRREVLERHVRERKYRVVEAAGDPVRDPADPARKPAPAAWRRKRLALCSAMIRDELPDGQTGAFLVWGDPALYDGTIDILHDILAADPGAFDFEVIPGITSVQALAARHRIPLNRLGGSVLITTGRKLAEGRSGDAENLVVLLDGDAGLRAAAKQDPEIFWGAYLGTGDEVLVSGRLREVVDEIERLRRTLRARKGWIMDTYLLRRPRGR
jgi:precorrin-6A synthase